MTVTEIVESLRPVVEVFERLCVRYYLSGSVASSGYGVARATLDVDIVAELEQRHVKTLVAVLQERYYLDENRIESAIRGRRSFNLIHLATMMKIDVFIPKERLFDDEALRRARTDVLDAGAKESAFRVATPEDVVLAKLEWYRRGGEVSERQWGDVLGVLKVMASKVDLEYMRRHAAEIGVLDLLERAVTESSSR
jgi:hypothetical protein